MIEERDLDAAVTAGILDAATRERLVMFARDHRRGMAGPDEESFRLLTGFNDIFVTIAVGLLLFAAGSLGGLFAPLVGSVCVAVLSWGLAEYFTRQRRMALPSIVLLLTFVGGVMTACTVLFTGATEISGNSGMIGVAAASAATAAAAYAHWRRFMVPITVAAGVAALGGVVLGSLAAAGALPSLMLLVILALGLACFALAMAFDSRDRARVTRWTDVAFWLHLLAAPAIIHPVFALSGLTSATPGAGAALTVVLVYGLLTVVALAIDRRALLVSALGYVIYAIQAVVSSGQGIGAGFGVTALFIGLFLVLLSAGWRPIRGRIIAMLPGSISAKLPVAA